jgi:hypothetical protein
MQKQTIQKDFARNKTVFTEEFERAKYAFFLELREKIKTKGWFNRLIFNLTKNPFLGY